MSGEVSSSFVFNNYLEALKDGEGFENGDTLGIAFINSDGAHVANPFTVSVDNINTWTSGLSSSTTVYNTFVIPNASIVNYYDDLGNNYFDAIVGNSMTYTFQSPADSFTAVGFVIFKKPSSFTEGSLLDSDCIPVCFAMFETVETNSFTVNFTDAIEISGVTKYVILKYTPQMSEIKIIVGGDGRVLVSGNDTDKGYLSDKIEGVNGIATAITSAEGGYEKLTVKIDTTGATSGQYLGVVDTSGNVGFVNAPSVGGNFIPMTGTGNNSISGYFQVDEISQFKVVNSSAETQAMMYADMTAGYKGFHIEEYGNGTGVGAHGLYLHSLNSGEVSIYGQSGVTIDGGTGIKLEGGSVGIQLVGSSASLGNAYATSLHFNSGILPPAISSAFCNSIKNSNSVSYANPVDTALITEAGVVSLVNPDYLENLLHDGTGITITNSGSYLVISSTGGGGGMVNPMTTSGDLIVGGDSGTPTRLAIGSQGQVLTVGTSGLEWVTVSGGMTNPMTSGGQMIYGVVGGTPSAINPPQIGQVLMGMGGSGAPFNFPQWSNASNVILFGMPWTSAGDIVYAGEEIPSGFQQGKRLVETLHIGTEGQLLTVNSSGAPEWKDKPKSCQENYAIVNSTSAFSASSLEGRILVSLDICNHDCDCTELGFALKSGSVGKVGMAIYDVNKNLVARTALFSASEAHDGHTYWHVTESPFKLVAGDEYYFAIWFGDDPYSNLLQVVGKENTTVPDSSYVGCMIGQQSITEMPSALGTLNGEQVQIHMSAR